MSILFLIVVGIVSALAAAVAAVSGFGIGSLVTPLLALQTGMKFAVAAVSIPHLVATAIRFWRLRQHVDRQVLWSFGLASAAGGLIGAVLHTILDSPILTLVLGCLLVFVGSTGVMGLTDRMRIRGWAVWPSGALSGLLGGLVGNQGGIRSAAMLGFDIPKHAFVATATAVALIVDGVRLPVYVWTSWREIAGHWLPILVATIGAVAGTFVGNTLLGRIPESVFRRVVSAILLSIGVLVLAQAYRDW